MLSFIPLLCVARPFSPILSLATSSKPAQTYSFSVKEEGTGPALIFIPGLACGGGVWQPTVDQLKDHYHCYVLTLPGFGGVTPTKDRPILEAVKNQILSFIKTNHIQKPVIIGHSLGGFLAWWLAESEPSNLSGIVAVDGVPFLPDLSMPALTAKMMEPYKTQVYNQLANVDGKKFADTEKASLKQMISNESDIAFVEKASGPPDQVTTAECMAEMMTTDLRPKVSRITCPALLMMSGKQYKENTSAVEANYLAQVKGVKSLSFKDFSDSLHFIMFDQPKEFMIELKGFLDKAESGNK